jgi:hypothetical protein
MKSALGGLVVLGLLATACSGVGGELDEQVGANASDVGDTVDVTEDVAEDQEAVVAVPPPAPLTEEEKQKAIETSLTGWKAKLEGSSTYPCTHNTIGIDCSHAKLYPATPQEADHLGTLRLTKNGDTKNSFSLSLYQHWRKGDAYFTDLMKTHSLTPLDLVGILAAIQHLEASWGPLPYPSKKPAPLQTFDCPECGDNPPWGPIPEGPNDDHRGPPPGPTTTPPHDHPNPPPAPHGGGSGKGKPPVTGPSDKEEQRLHDLENGVGARAPAPLPSPYDLGYTPLPNEHVEVFQCNGKIYRGWKHGCIDFKPVYLTTKWTDKVEDFFQSNVDWTRAWLLHNMWNDGKNPECTDTCNTYSNAECGLRLGDRRPSSWARLSPSALLVQQC